MKQSQVTRSAKLIELINKANSVNQTAASALKSTVSDVVLEEDSAQVYPKPFVRPSD